MILKSLSAGQADSDGFRSYRVAPAPDTYKVTFVAANANYQGSSEIVKDFTINIVEKF